jgi:hypothetical protein
VREHVLCARVMVLQRELRHLRAGPRRLPGR